MAEEIRHIREIADSTDATLQTSLDQGQMAIQSDGLKHIVYKDKDAGYHEVANLGEAAFFSTLALSAGTAPIGPGTINALAKFTSGSAVGDSILSDNGSIATVGGDLSFPNDAAHTISPADTADGDGKALTVKGGNAPTDHVGGTLNLLAGVGETSGTVNVGTTETKINIGGGGGTANSYVHLHSSLVSIEHDDGLDVNPGSDADADLVTVGVTGSPKFTWDESEDCFATTKGVTIAGDINTVKWTDYSAVSTILGFSAYDTKHIFYKKVGDLVFVKYCIEGTSNANVVSFTLPYSADGNIFKISFSAAATDNDAGLASPAMGTLYGGESIVRFYKTYAFATWTTSLAKAVFGEFFYRAP